MKTSRLLIIATIVAISTMSFTSRTDLVTKSNNSKTVVHLTLLEAVHYADLVDAMYMQLDDDFLELATDKSYTQTVYHANVIWVITGTYAQWELFFRAKVKFKNLDID